MFTIRVTYLTGRVYSSVFDDGDNKAAPEWPPHPSRLFSALVSAWGEGGAEENLRPALEWLEQQPPPVIHAGKHWERNPVQAFVPVNDQRSLPEDRSRKARVFPSATLANPVVDFVWPDAPPAEIIPALRTILSRTSALGHSASLIEATIADDTPTPGRIVWQPATDHGTRMRVPYAGRLHDLISAYRRFEKDPSKLHRPDAGETVLYAAVGPAVPAKPRHGVFGSLIMLRHDSRQPGASLRSTLAITTALRGAMLHHSPQPVPEFLSGHAPGSTSDAPIRSEKPHVALIPLANVGGQYADGAILGAAAVLPRTFTSRETAECWKAFGKIKELKMGWGTWKVELADAEERRSTLRPNKWSAVSKIWATVTPFVFDRYPKDPFGPESEDTVRQAFVRVGFPEPVEIDLHYNPWLAGAFKASAYPPAGARPGKPQRYHCHVWARFDEEIQGPVIAGAGRYYGYGLFLPFLERKEAK